MHRDGFIPEIDSELGPLGDEAVGDSNDCDGNAHWLRKMGSGMEMQSRMRDAEVAKVAGFAEVAS